ERVALVADAAQALDPADVHQQVGERQPEPQQRQQALAARDHLRVLTAIGQRPHRLAHRGGPGGFELRRDHYAPPLAAPSPLTAWIARQTFSSEQGMVTSRTPNGFSASTTAFTTAGVDAIAPASPTPLTPRRLVVAGVSVRSVVNDGRSAADGIR